MTTLAARRIAGFTIDAVLGRGRRSTVYLASKSNATVAVKVARQAHLPAGGFQREFEVAAALAHPRVIRVLEHGSEGASAFVAMEYAAGGSLADSRGALAAPMAARWIGEAAEAVGWLHRRGWVHRDVKPANLLVRADGSLALADFGCARRQGAKDAGEAGTVVGSPLYAAPEQHHGAAAQPGADVYSLGVILYELLTGRAPYPGETPAEIVAQHLCAPLPELPAQPQAWQPLLRAMLAKDPARRLPDGHAVLEQLRQDRPLGDRM